MSLSWTQPPASGEGHYLPGFRFTFLEHFGIKTARALAGKQITVSWQIRSSGCLIAPIIYRAGIDIPMPSRTPWPDVNIQLWSGPQYVLGPTIKRCDFTMTLPLVPPSTSIVPDSYLGIGLDMLGQSGPTIDIAPPQLNEGGPAPFEELRFWKD